jgi:hypothetical protein
MNELPDKNFVEAISFGDMVLSVLTSPTPLTTPQLQQLANQIRSLRDNLRTSSKLTGCAICRSVILTADIASEVSRWQDLLGEQKVPLSTDENSRAVGKYFVWGRGGTNTTYAVVII